MEIVQKTFDGRNSICVVIVCLLQISDDNSLLQRKVINNELAKMNSSSNSLSSIDLSVNWVMKQFIMKIVSADADLLQHDKG